MILCICNSVRKSDTDNYDLIGSCCSSCVPEGYTRTEYIEKLKAEIYTPDKNDKNTSRHNYIQ